MIPPRLEVLARELFELGSAWVQTSARPAAWAAPLWWARRPVLAHGELVRYRARSVGAELAIVTAGRASRVLPFCEHLFGVLEAPTALGRIALSSPGQFLAHDADLVATELHPHHAADFRRAGWLVVPTFVRWTTDLPLPGGRTARSLRSDRGKVRAEGYTARREDAPAAWQHFWQELAEPYASERFDEWAWTPSPPLRRLLERRGVLHLVYRGDDCVAGFVALVRRGRAWFPVLGARTDPELRQKAVISAIYTFAFAWAEQSGLARVDLGRSEAFVDDGVARYKQKWGLRPEADPMSPVLAVLPRERARAAFAHAPVHVLREAGLAVYSGEA